MKDVVIVAAGRTAVGSFGGVSSAVSAVDLGVSVVKGLLSKINLNPAEVNEMILGQVLTAGCGQNPARQTSIRSGIPENRPAITVNRVCGSGLSSVIFGVQSIRCNDADVVIAGGQESMDMAPHLLSGSRNGVKMGDWKMTDHMVKDGLTEAFNDYHMGVTAENIAEKWGLTREEQDAFAVESQRKAGVALDNDRFKDEIIPIVIPQKKGDPIVFEKDDYPKPNTTMGILSKLKPSFKKDGTVTAGNSSGINNGAAVVILMSLEKAQQLGLAPIAKIVSYATVGVAPEVMGTGPILASKLALQKAGWTVDDLDLIEANEAFAAQAICVNKEMGWDKDKINVNGGAIALGHPIGASGTRILVTLIHEMLKRKLHRGIATLCVGGGMGVAVTVEI